MLARASFKPMYYVHRFSAAAFFRLWGAATFSPTSCGDLCRETIPGWLCGRLRSLANNSTRLHEKGNRVAELRRIEQNIALKGYAESQNGTLASLAAFRSSDFHPAVRILSFTIMWLVECRWQLLASINIGNKQKSQAQTVTGEFILVVVT